MPFAEESREVTQFRNLDIGATVHAGPYLFTEEELTDFGRKYDPQPFHLDNESAQDSIFGSVIASGLQSLAVCFKLFMETGALGNANLGGIGMDDVRFLKPIRAGDTVKIESKIVESRHSQSKPERSIVHIAHKVENDEGQEVLRFTVIHVVSRTRITAEGKA